MLQERLKSFVQSGERSTVLCRDVLTPGVNDFLADHELHSVRLIVVEKDDGRCSIIVYQDSELVHEMGGNGLALLVRDVVGAKFGNPMDELS